MSSLVSIIIPCYNQGQFLAEAIQSVLNQDYQEKEIVVVNDGSLDNTREVAQAFGDSIRYVEQTNKGLPSARNAGIRIARGEYIAFLDSDDQYLPHTLSTAVSFLDLYSDTAMVCGDAFLLKDNEIMGLKSTKSRRPRNPVNFRWETVEYYATPSTVVLRNSCFAKVGLFDENLTIGAEDWLMWVQLSLYFNMCYIDKPLIYYRLHDSNVTLDKERMDTANRYAVNLIVNAPYFNDYPANFRAKLLFYRFATAWSVETKRAAIRYFLRALKTDPTQFPYGLRVFYRGLSNTLRGHFSRLSL